MTRYHLNSYYAGTRTLCNVASYDTRAKAEQAQQRNEAARLADQSALDADYLPRLRAHVLDLDTSDREPVRVLAPRYVHDITECNGLACPACAEAGHNDGATNWA